VIPDFALLNPGYFLPQFENFRILRTLAEKSANQGSVSQLPRSRSKQRVKKILVASEGWLAAAEFLDRAPRGEIKEPISLSYEDAGHLTAAGGASAVPAGKARHLAPGRLRENARPASRPVCDFVAGLGQAETDNARLLAASQEERWS
jgi:hypothetical protein